MNSVHSGASPPQVGLGWVLFAVALALPWLTETHTSPWTMFYQGWGMAALLLALAAWAGMAWTARWRVTWLALGVAAFTLVPVAQAAGGLLTYPAEGVLVALHLAGFGLAILTGLRAETIAAGRAAESLLTGVAVAAFVSVGLQLYQWLQLDGLGVLVLQMSASSRPFANVGQPNLLATLLVWGLIAMWWATEHERIGAAGAVAGAAFLLLGVAMTQSRAGWLEVGLLAVVAMWRSNAMRRPLPRVAVLILALWFIVAVLVWPRLVSQFGVGPVRSLTDTVAVNERLGTWRLAAEAIAARPWLGWGWNQGTAAQVALVGERSSWQPLSPYMHSLPLDLLLWNGVPLGLLAMLGLGAWFVARWRRGGDAKQRLLLLALAALLIHSMLELPHGDALFLLPAGLMMGMVEAGSGARSVLTLPRWGVGTLILALAAALGLLVSEYRTVERDLLSLRMREARIANQPPLGPAPRLALMAPFGELLASLRVTPEPGMDPGMLDRLHRVAHHYPSTGNLLRLAQADALNGRPGQAREALILLCQLQPPASCQGAARIWREWGRVQYPALAAIEPPGVTSSGPVAAGDAATMPRHSSGPR